jgi:D-methionine transport system substrate-binding protein
MKFLSVFSRIVCLSACLLLSSCKKTEEVKLQVKIAATTIPHAEILSVVKENLLKEDIDLDIIVVEDYTIPNRALADYEIDANFFQHQPFLEYEKKLRGYPIINFAQVHLEPMGLYSKKIEDLSQVSPDARLAIPSDPTNQARALRFLETLGLIRLHSVSTLASMKDVAENMRNVVFVEMEASHLAGSLKDVEMAVITTNFALQASLSPEVDALAIEDRRSEFVNILAIRQGDENRAELLALKRAINSDVVRDFIEESYEGAVIPAF